MAAMRRPKRIQLSRRKGCRLPASAVNVARPTRWGNPYRVVRHAQKWWVVKPYRLSVEFATKIEAAAHAVEEYALWLLGHRPSDDLVLSVASKRLWILAHLHELEGRDLACWCSIDAPCHADVLMIMAREGVEAYWNHIPKAEATGN